MNCKGYHRRSYEKCWTSMFPSSSNMSYSFACALQVLELVDACTFIPTVGFTQSLNVSTAAAIVFHQALRLRAENNSEQELTHKKTLAQLYIRSMAAKGWDYEQFRSALAQ
eukprot:m.185728 g.185728  ORF g.185728 m.185728 type:complete len:111 (+) comp15581_c0_seq7:935-1267(+)